MCEWNNGGSVVLPLKDGFIAWKENRSVCVDECIAPHIKALWDAGYETKGCCCGHGKENSSVIINEDYTQNQINNIRNILESIDSRPWDIFQWQLVKT